MTHEQILNWLALYTATAISCVITAGLAALSLAWQLSCEKPWQAAYGWRDLLLAVPRYWWRWQKLYWIGTPMILAIIAFFAATLDWS